MAERQGCTGILNPVIRFIRRERRGYVESLSEQELNLILSTPGIAEGKYRDLLKLAEYTGLGSNVALRGITDTIMFRNKLYEAYIETVRDTKNNIDLGSKTTYTRALDSSITTLPDRTITIGDKTGISFSETLIYPSQETDRTIPRYIYEITIGRTKYSYYQNREHRIDHLTFDQKRTIVKALKLKLP